jgi:hypothetical protein
MKYPILIFFLFLSVSLSAQFKDQNKPVNVRQGIVQNENSSLYLGFINPDNFSMNHTISMSYSASQYAGVALGVYTNTMAYKFTDNLNIEVDASLVNSPYSTYGEEFAKQINGIYLDRIQMNYQPSDNTNITLEFNQFPLGFSRNSHYYSPFYSRW